MNKIALFGGTTEGRLLAEQLKELSVPFVVCVATGYGKEALKQGGRQEIPVHTGRMEESQMQEFFQKEEISLVLDATHPYAVKVTENLKKTCKMRNISYLRILREEDKMQEIMQNNGAVRVKSVADAVRFLEGKEGNILISTGSKELKEYTKLTGYQKRCFARVLSTEEAVKESVKLGFDGPHLIAMQGPFSREMNMALLRQTEAKWFVTKESGKAGGFREKEEAAAACGAVLVVVERPKQGEGIFWEEALELVKIRNPVEKIIPAEKEVFLIGLGPGSREGMTGEAWRLFNEADLVLGAGRMTAVAREEGLFVQEAYLPGDVLEILEEAGRKKPSWKKAAVLLSGDVSFYSGAKKLDSALTEAGYQVRLIPGISSVSVLAAKIGKEISEAELLSLHGRECNVVSRLLEKGKVFLLTDRKETIENLCKELTGFSMGEVQIWIGCRLSYPDERILQGTAGEFAGHMPDVPPLSVLYLEAPGSPPFPLTYGMADERFLRGNVPMTKAEVRSVSISALELTRDAVVYDVGAGTGSVSVEAARISRDGRVYAIERNPEGLKLIQENRKRFAVSNLTTVAGEAPEVLSALPAPTHVFIGGSGGNIQEILELVWKKNPGARVVVNAITPETVAACLDYGRKREEEIQTDITQIICARGKRAGTSHLMMGMNPVYILTMYCREKPYRKNDEKEGANEH